MTGSTQGHFDKLFSRSTAGRGDTVVDNDTIMFVTIGLFLGSAFALSTPTSIGAVNADDTPFPMEHFGDRTVAVEPAVGVITYTFASGNVDANMVAAFENSLFLIHSLPPFPHAA